MNQKKKKLVVSIATGVAAAVVVPSVFYLLDKKLSKGR
jgi:hypothetical protein